jgi:hypothetical protein
MKIFIGTDPEFMAKYGKHYVYPILGVRGNDCLPDDNNLRFAVSSLSADEFGHCVEIRPTAAESGEQLVLNTIHALAKLPRCFSYHANNTHLIDKKKFIEIIRSVGRKDLSQSINVYGKDILDDCEADIEARKNGQRLLFCGCHMHISATRSVHITKNDQTFSRQENVELPVKTLVWLFDQIIFPCFRTDPDFEIGRYRSPGFYELKGHGGFEYRSLGSSTLTPRRLMLVADIMIEIVKRALPLIDEIMLTTCTGSRNGRDVVGSIAKHVEREVAELKRTKPVTTDLLKAWVPYLQ